MTWFNHGGETGILLGVGNKCGSSSLRHIAAKNRWREFTPEDARAHALKTGLHAALILRDPSDRLASAYSYFQHLGWPRVGGYSHSSPQAFLERLRGDIAEGRVLDPHWNYQVASNRVGGEPWWDSYMSFEYAMDTFCGEVRKNRGPLRGMIWTPDEEFEIRMHLFKEDWDAYVEARFQDLDR